MLHTHTHSTMTCRTKCLLHANLGTSQNIATGAHCATNENRLACQLKAPTRSKAPEISTPEHFKVDSSAYCYSYWTAFYNGDKAQVDYKCCCELECRSPCKAPPSPVGTCGNFEIWVFKIHNVSQSWGIVWLQTPCSSLPQNKQANKLNKLHHYNGTTIHRIAINGIRHHTAKF